MSATDAERALALLKRIISMRWKDAGVKQKLLYPGALRDDRLAKYLRGRR